MTDWGNIVDEVMRFLRENPDYRSVEAKLWAYVLNSLSPQSGAHFRTMMGGIGEYLHCFKDMYGPSLEEFKKLAADDEMRRAGK